MGRLDEGKYRMTSTQPDAKSADRYLELVRAFPLRPIRATADLDRGLAVLDSLLALGTLDIDEKDYVDVLADLIEKFEESEHPFPAVSEAEMLRHLIDAREITQGTLAADTGIAPSTISAILSGKRGLTRDHIATLAGYFQVSPAVFISSVPPT